MKSIAIFLLSITANLGYLGVFFLMTVESSFIPFPSEIVIPPAAYLASQGEMNLFFIILVGVAGSLAGALINYLIAYTFGRKVIYSLVNTRWAKYLLLNEKNLLKAENYFNKYGNMATFICRFVPAVRQLISLPAGFTKMNIWSFIFYTISGSTFWVSILAFLGYYYGANQEKLARYYQEITYAGIILGALFLIYLLYQFQKNKNEVN